MKVEIHPPQVQNITTKKQNNNNKEYIMHKEPPKLNDKNFPEIKNTIAKTSTNANRQSKLYITTVIPKTPIEQQQQNEETIEFLSPSLVSKTTLTNSTP